MHTACSRLVGTFAALLLLLSSIGLTRGAATSTIGVTKATDLMLPTQNTPAGFTMNLSLGRAINNSMLLTVLGRHMSFLFHKDGWVTGYHGWLNANDPRGDAFVTYDFYGFKSSVGARAAIASYLGLILGVQYPSNDGRLPANATVFIDGTGTFDPNSQPFTVVEIVFPVNNVLADVTGYYAGGDSAAADAAREATISATAALSGWLFSQSHPAQHSVLAWPLIPVALLASGRRMQHRRRGA